MWIDSICVKEREVHPDTLNSAFEYLAPDIKDRHCQLDCVNLESL